MSYFVVFSFCWLLFTIIKYKKVLHMFQQNGYNVGNRYLKWVFNNYKKIYSEIDVLFVTLVFGFIFLNNNIAIIIGGIFYLMFSFIHYKSIIKEQTKKPLVITSRLKRLIFTLFILHLIPIIFIYKGFNYDNMIYYYISLSLIAYMSYLLVYLANLINYPIIEKYYFYYFMKKAKNKLKSMKHLKIIGVSGSYGKTSTKNILADILNVNYNALASPKNLNTPNGLMITINNYLDKFTDIFIAEMGAYKVGEVKDLCDLVSPQYGILTKIGLSHLESYGTQENLQKGDFELIEALPSNGIGILNADDELQVNYKLKNKCKLIWIGIDNKNVDVYASDIIVSKNGIVFNVNFKDDKKTYPFETKLLGYFNVYNILASIALGKELGLNINQLQNGVKRVKAIEHRLQLKKYKDINIIDDAYNSNPVGAKMALDVLSIMPGKKIIVTPGMIELGDQQYALNKIFGEQIADVCDAVILVGEKQTAPIQEGLNVKKYDKSKLHIINDVKLAFKIIERIKSEETYVLLENDLPDIFNE